MLSKTEIFEKIQEIIQNDYFAVSSPPISIWSPLIRETSPPLFLTRIRISRQPIRASSPLNSFFCV